MSDQRQTITDPVFERSPVFLTLQLTDQNDVPLSKLQLVSVKATLYNKRFPAVFINDREHQSILDENGGSVSSDGVLSLVLGEDDNGLTNQANRKEDHVLLLEWEWVDGVGPGFKEITYPLINQVQVS